MHDKGDIFVLRHSGFLYVHLQFSLGMLVDIEVAFSYHSIICIVYQSTRKSSKWFFNGF